MSPYLMPQLRPPHEVCPPSGPAAPVLAVKALLPEGVTINAQPGNPHARGHASGAVFGFRPGYSYPMALSNLPGHPGRTLYPVLEIRGSIVPRPGMKYMEISAPLVITRLDIDRALQSGTITKVIYLENPDLAIPIAATADQPIEATSNSPDDAEREARANGRIVAVLRMGDREPTREELSAMSVPNTVLMPGETKLGTPPVPPCNPNGPIPLYDPLLGPKALTDECFKNGGDTRDALGVGRLGVVGGLDATDVVAEYMVGKTKKVSTSNTVCICSPRFVIRRAETHPFGFHATNNPGQAIQVTRNNVFRQRSLVEYAIAREKSLGLIGQEKPSVAINNVYPQAVGAVSKPSGFASANGLQVVAAVIEPEEVTNYPDQLTLTKTVSPAGPVPQGSELTITIRYANHTRSAVKDLVISDSLSARLEYVPGSAAADRPSNVTTYPNESGSVVIRFDLPGEIPPSTGGIVRFKVKVR